MNILWDFDGTLFNTYPAYVTVFKKVLKEEVSEEQILAKLKISFTHAVGYFKLSDNDS